MAHIWIWDRLDMSKSLLATLRRGRTFSEGDRHHFQWFLDAWYEAPKHVYESLEGESPIGTKKEREKGELEGGGSSIGKV